MIGRRTLSTFSAKAAYDAPGAASAYRDYTMAPWRQYGERFTLGSLLGDLRGRRVLDLACGDGTNARWLHDTCGAGEVVGVDISPAMIAQAQEQTPRSSRIKYMVGNAADVGLGALLKDEKFDVVLACYLLNYATTEEELTSFLRGARRVLKDGENSLFCAANDYSEPASAPGGTIPANGVVEMMRHGFRKTIDPSQLGVDGAPVLVELYQPEPPHADWPTPPAPPGTSLLSFFNFYLSQETHTRAFQRAGFEDAERHFISISPEGLALCPDGWWDELVASRTVVYYRAAPDC